MRIILGAIADDFTGATDLANNLVRAGMRCVPLIGAPQTLVVSHIPGDAAFSRRPARRRVAARTATPSSPRRASPRTR